MMSLRVTRSDLIDHWSSVADAAPNPLVIHVQSSRRRHAHEPLDRPAIVDVGYLQYRVL